MIHTQPIRHLDWVEKPSMLEVYHLGVFLAAESGKGVGPVLLVVELILVGVFLRTLIEMPEKSWAKVRSIHPMAESLAQRPALPPDHTLEVRLAYATTRVLNFGHTRWLPAGC